MVCINMTVKIPYSMNQRVRRRQSQGYGLAWTSLKNRLNDTKNIFLNRMPITCLLVKIFLILVTGITLGTPLSALAAEVAGAAQKADTSYKKDGQSTLIPETLLDLINKEQPLALSPGIIRIISGYPDDRAIAVFCATALNQHGVDHEKFITLIRDELVDQNYEGIGKVVAFPKPYFLQSIDRQDVFIRCLENNLSATQLETLYRLFQIEWAVNSGKTANYSLLVRLADNGHIPAKYLLAKELFFLASGPSDKNRDELEKYTEVTAEKYHQLLISVAENGNKRAQMDLARFYVGDYGYKIWGQDPHLDVEEAVHWFKLLAAQEENLNLHDSAIERIAFIYYHGAANVIGFFRGPKKSLEYKYENLLKADRREALKWLQKIPEERLKNTCMALTMFYEIYSDGDVVEKNIDQERHYRDVFYPNCIKF